MSQNSENKINVLFPNKHCSVVVEPILPYVTFVYIHAIYSIRTTDTSTKQVHVYIIYICRYNFSRIYGNVSLITEFYLGFYLKGLNYLINQLIELR